MLKHLPRGQSCPRSQDSARAPCSHSGSKPCSEYLEVCCSLSGGSPGSWCSPRRCVWAWGVQHWGPGPPSERHPASPETLCASASSHPGTCQSVAASGPMWLPQIRLCQGLTGCPPAPAAVGAWPSPRRHFWHWLHPWPQQLPAT